MTRKQFWADPYQTRLETRVARVDGQWVTLAETIIYAESGGQESDRGIIGEHPVLEARWEGLDIRYDLGPDHGLSPGDVVAVEVDWTRRYRLMRLHFAAEVILELTTRALPDALKIGAHIAEDKARIDFAWPEPVTPLLPALAEAAAKIVEQDHEIVSAFSDESAERRYWEVPGFARVPCGGTHLKRTGEVGRLRLRRKNTGKGKERIEITLTN